MAHYHYLNDYDTACSSTAIDIQRDSLSLSLCTGDDLFRERKQCDWLHGRLAKPEASIQQKSTPYIRELDWGFVYNSMWVGAKEREESDDLYIGR